MKLDSVVRNIMHITGIKGEWLQHVNSQVVMLPSSFQSSWEVAEIYYLQDLHPINSVIRKIILCTNNVPNVNKTQAILVKLSSVV